ncbi:aspartic proteinase NANA, chloroplast-like [Phragmites australis]|uniref:aspartic proteinase NANA, chloroplast-like n=1 Tax=Phragmites australis TaxID=29695 RepID=UPI002D77872F|nr:aspartic proteinase NANA, chloroplast-like [Phragmites australis]
MQGRSVASVLLLLSLHGLLRPQLQLVASAEIEDDVDVETGSSCHLLVTPPVVPDSAEERREHYRAMEAKDLLRHQQIIQKDTGTGGRRQARESSKLPEVMSDDSSMFELPMRSAINIAHVGMYIVSVRFGTPALPYNLVLDTATDLTWINCRLRRRKGKHYGRPRVQQSPTVNTLSVDGEGAPVRVLKNWYRPALSSSWRRFRCSQKACAVLPYNTCESPNQTASCSYRQVVQDGTTTSGIYGQEKATVALSGGRMAKLPGLILGCSTFEAGGSVDSHDGVLSLGNSDISFGIHAAKRFGARFSFCLLSTHSGRNASSYLTFGSNPAVKAPDTMETTLNYNPDMVAYGARVTGITLGGELLDIPPEVWDQAIVGAGMVLDTGTSVTGLVPSAYAAVTTALDSHLGHLQRVTNIAGFEFCYNWTFTGDGVDPAHNVTIPKFTVELEGGARLEPDAKSVVMPEVVPGVACLAFRKLPSGPGIFGNVLMQEHIWEFDHMDEKLRFRKDKCINHHLNPNNSNHA